MQHRQQSARRGSLLVRQNLPPHPVLRDWRSAAFARDVLPESALANVFRCLQSTNKHGEGKKKNAKEFGLNILNTRRSFSRMVSHYRDVYTCRVCALFWQSLSPVCLLIEILIDISEGDFNHKGVVHAYLSEPQRKKRISSPTLSPFSHGSLCQERNVPKDTSPVQAM